MQSVSFDLISDLNLTEKTDLNWSGKSTGLYCIVAGNVSRDLQIVKHTLAQLSECYQGVFFIDGALEQGSPKNRDSVVDECMKLCDELNNVVYLHDNVSVIDGVAVLGINGWYGNAKYKTSIAEVKAECWRNEDAIYAGLTMEQLQRHDDITQILMVSSSPPAEKLFFGEHPDNLPEYDLRSCLLHDLEGKVSHWAYGSYKKVVDVVFDDIHYVCNPFSDFGPYFPKRIDVAY